MSRGRPDPLETVRRQREVEARRRKEARRLDDAGRDRSVPDWAAPAKDLKLRFVASTPRGDLPPTVVARRGGRGEAIAIAPQVDKDLGFEAAWQLRRAMDPDELIFVTDAHAFKGKAEGDYEEARGRWPGGLMQNACDEHDACATGEIMDCLTVCRIQSGDRLSVATIGYHYHGVGTSFRWDDRPWWTDRGEISGYVPDSLRRIMAEPALIHTPDFEAILRACPSVDPERGRYILAAETFRRLEREGYLVIDLLSGLGPSYEPMGARA